VATKSAAARKPVIVETVGGGAAVAKHLTKTLAIDVAPLSRFKIAPENPRTDRRKEDIADRAASMKAEGQLMPVICYAETQGGVEWLMITAGGTRFCAAPAAGLSVLWYERKSKEDAIRAGLVEQESSTPLSPADQARAYAAELDRLNGDGPLTRDAAVETIAARVGKTARFVAQRLALAGLFPPILEALAKGGISVKQAEAWANAPVERQQQLWLNKSNHDADPDDVKRMVDKADLADTDRLAKFVGADAYKAAGGAVRQDLFDIDLPDWEKRKAGGGRLDKDLVQKLAREKLAEAKKKLEAEGWGEVKTTLGVSHSGYSEKAKPKTKEERAKYRAEISIDHNGKLEIVRGLRIKTKEATEKKASSSASNWNDPVVKAQREEHSAVTDVATQIVGRAFFGKVSVALAALLAALSRETFRELQLFHGGLFDLSLYSSSLTPRGLSSDAGYKAKRAELVRLLKPHKADLETFIHDVMTDDQRGMLLAFLVSELMSLNEGMPDDVDLEGRRQLATLGRLAGANPASHGNAVPAALAKIVTSPLVSELTGWTSPAKAKAPAKKSAKGKK